MAGTFGAASIPMFGCACLLAVLVLQVLSFASPFWANDGVSEFGLWKYAKCIPTKVFLPSDSACYRLERAWDVDEWLHAVRGLECLAIIFWSLPIVIVPVYLYVALGLYYRCIMVSMTVFVFFGTVSNVIGVLIFGTKIGNNDAWTWEWCIIVAGCAGILGVLAFILFLIACCYRPIFASQTHLMSGFYVDPDRNKMYVVENVEETKPGPLEAGHVNPAMEG